MQPDRFDLCAKASHVAMLARPPWQGNVSRVGGASGVMLRRPSEKGLIWDGGAAPPPHHPKSTCLTQAIQQDPGCTHTSGVLEKCACYNRRGSGKAAQEHSGSTEEVNVNIAQVLRGLASLSWVAALVIIGLAVVRAARGQAFKTAGTIVAVVVVAALLLTSAGAGMVFIQPEERGIVISAVAPEGYRPTALPPGLHWVIPFAESVITYPISRQTYTMSIAAEEGAIKGDDSVSARTADGQEVLIDASVIFSIDPDRVIDVHIAWQNRYDTDLVRPLARGIIRDEAAQFGVEEIVSSKRQELIDGIRSRLTARLEDNGVQLDEFVLRNITFTPEYAASVEQKQIAEQQAEQARLTVEQRRQEAEQARQVAQGQADAAVIAAEGRAKARVIEAEAEAEALQKIAAALRDNPEVLTFEYIDKLAPGIQVMLVPSNSPYLLPLPTLEPTNATPTAAPSE
jgi:regulator of protease activity HflC (stomatin/prohibitin superfamily)